MKRIIFLILLFFSFSASASASLTESWSFNDNLYNSVWNWIIYSANTIYSPWKVNNSIELNGVNSSLFFQNIPWIKTISFYFNPFLINLGEGCTSKVILSQTNWWNKNIYFWITNNNKILYQYSNNIPIIYDYNIIDWQFYKIDIVENNSYVYIYINSVLLGSSPWIFNDLNFNFWKYGDLNVCYLKIKIDELKIYNNSLTTSEIITNYNNENPSSSSSSSSSSGGFINIDLTWITTVLTDLFTWFTAFFTNIWDFLTNLTDFNFTYTGFNFDLQKYKNVFSFDFWERIFVINNENCENIIKPLLIYHRYYQLQSNMVDNRPYNIDNSILAFYYELKTNNNPIWEYPWYSKNVKIVNSSNNYYYKLYKNEFNYLSITNKNLFSVNINVFDDFNIIPFSVSIFGFDVINLINAPLKYFFKLVLLIIELPISLINIIANMYFYLFPPFVAGESYCYAGQLITIPTGFNSGNRISWNNNYWSILYILILSFVAFIKWRKVIKNL